MKKIQLDITPAVVEYAAMHGALYDKENGWYCFEPIPIGLEEFAESETKLIKPYDDKYIQCPKCGGQMQIKPTRIGGVFWSCMSFPRCKGARSVDEAEDQHFKKVLKPAPDNKDNFVINTSQNYRDLYELGIKELGCQKSFENWLTKPKIALEGKRPIEVINTDEGYSNVMNLLRKTNQ